MAENVLIKPKPNNEAHCNKKKTYKGLTCYQVFYFILCLFLTLFSYLLSVLGRCDFWFSMQIQFN